jgi:hypothetical protein
MVPIFTSPSFYILSPLQQLSLIIHIPSQSFHAPHPLGQLLQISSPSSRPSPAFSSSISSLNLPSSTTSPYPYPEHFGLILSCFSSSTFLRILQIPPISRSPLHPTHSPFFFHIPVPIFHIPSPSAKYPLHPPHTGYPPHPPRPFRPLRTLSLFHIPSPSLPYSSHA